jgi:hypothetical protein
MSLKLIGMGRSPNNAHIHELDHKRIEKDIIVQKLRLFQRRALQKICYNSSVLKANMRVHKHTIDALIEGLRFGPHQLISLFAHVIIYSVDMCDIYN